MNVCRDKACLVSTLGKLRVPFHAQDYLTGVIPHVILVSDFGKLCGFCPVTVGFMIVEGSDAASTCGIDLAGSVRRDGNPGTMPLPQKRRTRG